MKSINNRIAAVIAAAMCCTALICTGCAPEADDSDSLLASAPISDSSIQQSNSIPGAYSSIITQYHTALTEQWGGQQYVDAGMNYMVRDCCDIYSMDGVGYSVRDIDGDGISELVIGTIADDEFYGKMIYLMYTLDDSGAPLQLINSIERDRWYYAGGINFANLGSSSFDSSFVTTLKLEDREMVDMTYTTDPADYVQMELIPFPQWSE